MLSRPALIVRYTAFAGLAMAVNLLTQYASFTLYTGIGSLYLGMALGTGTGLLTKYLLDKYFIFFDYATSLGRDTRQFTVYSAMGIFTTLIFWGTELAFAAIGEATAWRYVGGALGLIVGYTLKYQLDRRFVFRPAAS